jgi:hypothetical protein
MQCDTCTWLALQSCFMQGNLVFKIAKDAHVNTRTYREYFVWIHISILFSKCCAWHQTAHLSAHWSSLYTRVETRVVSQTLAPTLRRCNLVWILSNKQRTPAQLRSQLSFLQERAMSANISCIDAWGFISHPAGYRFMNFASD